MSVVVYSILSAIGFVLVGDATFSTVAHFRCKSWESGTERGAGGVRVGCEDFSLGEGEVALLLVHGFADSPALWRQMAPELAAAGFHCRAMRLPGSAVPVKDMRAVSDEDWTRAVSDEVTRLRKHHREVWIVAHSLGCAIALRSLLDGAVEADGIVMVAPLIEVSAKRSPVLKPRTWFEIGRRIMPFTKTVENVFPVIVHGELDRAILRDQFVALEIHENLFRTTDAISGRAPELDIPLLMFVSDHDKIIDSPMAEAYFDDAKSAVKQRVKLRDAGHVIPLDNGWRDVTRHLEQFIRTGKPVPPRGEIFPAD